MYHSAPVATSDLSYSNGHLSPLPKKPMVNGAITPSSDSDLSEAMDVPNDTASSPSNGSNDLREDGRIRESEPESIPDEDALGSDDPDYNIATPPPGNSSTGRDARSSSQGSPQHKKRKNGAEPDDYILSNPELYGLRRSVSSAPFDYMPAANLTS